MYADDVAVFSQTQENNVNNAIALVKHFCHITGAAVNLEKCSGFWHGTWATKPSEFEGFK